jgi:DNA-binding MarR family transcriptional regulator
MQDKAYQPKDGGAAATLSEAHRRVLVEGSGIDPAVLAERGVRTVRKGHGELPSTYPWRQKKRAPGILFTLHRPSGRTATIFRPDKPDPNNAGHKYLQESKRCGGSGNVLDVHPSTRHLIDDAGAPVVFVEGVKKADALTSAARAAGVDLLAVAISGVWNWQSGGEPIPDMFDIPVEGRRALVCFDSDMVRKPGVQMAAERLAEHLKRRGAGVEVVFLPDQPDGSKNGADDYLVGGATLEGLLTLARPYDPADFQREKLSRNEKLRRALNLLTRREGEMPTKSQRDCSKLAAWRSLVAHAARLGKSVEDGVEVGWLSARTGAETAGMSQPTFSKCVASLEADGYLRRGERETKEQATPYVLLVDPSEGGVLRYHSGEKQRRREGEGDTERESHPGDNVIPPLPEMRWSVPGRKARRGLVEGTRRVRQGASLSDDVPSKRRPGKKRGEVVRYLAEKGGAAAHAELLERFGGPSTTWRDFKKQTLADLLGHRRQYKGAPLSVGPPVVELTDEGIRLVDGWREAWEQHRTIGAEQEAADEQKRNHLMQRIAYRRRNEKPADTAPTEEEMAQHREGRAKRRRVERLVYEGMARRFANLDVMGADGFVGELRGATAVTTAVATAAPSPERKMPPKVNGVYVHGQECDCDWCTL